MLALVTSFSALVLGVTLYAITREEDRDLALLAMMCRVIEAIPLGVNRSAFFFAVGSTIFCWLLLRGRMLPAWLAWLGLISSALLVVALPLDLVGAIPGAVVGYLWIPMAAFEIPLGVLLLARGLPLPAKVRAA